MWNEDSIINYLEKNLNNHRYIHSLNVSKTAVKLAELYGADINKAKIAGLIHDCAKKLSNEELLIIFKNNNIKVDAVSINSPQLLHGWAAAIIAEQTMGINDEEILSAVKYHTTGKKNMSLLEKIIYIADYIEPGRDFEGVDELRKMAYESLDEGLLKAFDSTIEYVIERNQLIHLDTIEGRNFLLINKK
ncbi:MAG: phosphohydrolase [Clostridiaceae bacterium]|nr:phosphohydrolase [Clostridiaceae bacterium]